METEGEGESATLDLSPHAMNCLTLVSSCSSLASAVREHRLKSLGARNLSLQRLTFYAGLVLCPQGKEETGEPVRLFSFVANSNHTSTFTTSSDITIQLL